ncbi:hypothetical protein KZ483_07180 [Paenibacillus sp. sptzw28]|uniref:hypothetical protein n=1 Tax=Paenibacillus sp. sptzw28 TaxID=715179 RepID=UPI001C6F387A|nr:hypothetical protein [Paenibacillus sp. sptzw28]QYR22721.1 hypothetical protein KZ483_07180 [Paenibacillus sp. sptzw28]
MNRRTVVLLFTLSSILSIASIFLISAFTVSPDKISGNGNLGLIFLPVYCIFLIASMTFGFLLLRRIKIHAILPIIALFMLVFSTIQEFRLIKHRIQAVGGGIDEPNSKIYRLNWINQYTNDIWANGYIWLIAISLIVLIAYLFKRQKNEFSI